MSACQPSSFHPGWQDCTWDWWHPERHSQLRGTRKSRLWQRGGRKLRPRHELCADISDGTKRKENLGSKKSKNKMKTGKIFNWLGLSYPGTSLRMRSTWHPWDCAPRSLPWQNLPGLPKLAQTTGRPSSWRSGPRWDDFSRKIWWSDKCYINIQWLSKIDWTNPVFLFQDQPVFYLEAYGAKLLCVLNPSSIHHPDGVGSSLSANHEKGRTAGLVKGAVDPITLFPSSERVMYRVKTTTTFK